MIKILKETFAILNRNFWLLFLFMTISYIGLIYFSVLRASADTLIQVTIGLITLVFLAVAGVAGLFNSIRATIDTEVSTEEAPRIELLKTFPKGVSEYFFSALGIVAIYTLITFLVFTSAMMLGKSLIGVFAFTPEDLAKAMESVEALDAFQKSITPEDYLKLKQWHFLYIVISSILTYLLMYWLPETFYKTKNVALSLFRGVKKVILNPLKTFILFLVIVSINVLISLSITVIAHIPVLMFLVYLIYFYGLLYIMMLTFNYYRHQFVETEKVFIAEAVEEEVEEENDESEDGEN